MGAKEILEKITDDDIIQIMESLGSDNYKIVSNGILFRTICHNGENEGKLKLHYHSETKTFFCYTECGNLSNIFNLIMHIKECKFNDAYKYVCDLLNISIINQGLTKGFKQISDNSFINKFNVKISNDIDDDKELKPVNESILNEFYNLYHESWIKDYISVDVMEEFNIKFDILNGCIVIPHYDINGDLIGVRGRYLSRKKVDEGKKYMPLTINGVLYNYPTSLNLFGLNINLKNIVKYKKITIGESEKFVMQHKTFYPNTSTAVGLNGSSLSKEQIKIIKDLGVETIILALDKEYENKDQENNYSIKIRKGFIEKLKTYFNIEIIWDKIDGLLNLKESPTDRGKEVYDKLYKDRIIIDMNY